ncbi:hypothetical protein GCM10008171_01580 [Methylopila jiangsuensis]|uniref:Uncharacterized protein n=1 Tax=Methylopila jiangsuensis TaxID=586230 RepID=A0A9W6N258_9HYPH|nr:hypothetical protein [Methylopila jiangsuensis]MDR6287325.1 hypothetical protein [Methylopila jiangsuensis]GLK74905.1 hypothetical protein GCM10008171_01580 [Methylopila jiangsuensis]
MLSLTEAITLRTANDRIAEVTREANSVIAQLQRALENERAARRGDRAAYEADMAAMGEEIELLRELVAEGRA